MKIRPYLNLKTYHDRLNYINERIEVTLNDEKVIENHKEIKRG